MSPSHPCTRWGSSFVFPSREKEERCSDHRFHLIRRLSLPLAPSSASHAVQLDAQSWIGWSRCLGRADIFETLLPWCAQSVQRDILVFIVLQTAQHFFAASCSLLIAGSQTRWPASQDPATQSAHAVHTAFGLGSSLVQSFRHSVRISAEKKCRYVF